MQPRGVSPLIRSESGATPLSYFPIALIIKSSTIPLIFTNHTSFTYPSPSPTQSHFYNTSALTLALHSIFQGNLLRNLRTGRFLDPNGDFGKLKRVDSA